jgi:hypothetical protein
MLYLTVLPLACQACFTRLYVPAGDGARYGIYRVV